MRETFDLNRRLTTAESLLIDLEKRLKSSEGRSAADARHLEYIMSHLDMTNVSETFVTDLSTSIVNIIGAPKVPATYVIGGVDSEDTDRADYVCDGVDDQVQFKTAIDLLPNISVVAYTAAAGGADTITFPDTAPGLRGYFTGDTLNIYSGTGSGQSGVVKGYTAARVATMYAAWATQPDATSVFTIVRRQGKIVVMEGTYTLTSGICVPSGVTIEGMGYGTYFKPASTFVASDASRALLQCMTESAYGSITTGHITIANLRVEAGLSGQHGLGYGGHDSLFKNIRAEVNYGTSNGIVVGTPVAAMLDGGGDRCEVVNCRANGIGLAGMILWETEGVLVNGCQLYANTYYGLYNYKSSYGIISGNLFSENGTAGLEIDSTSNDNLVQGNTFRDNGTPETDKNYESADLVVYGTGDRNAILSNIFRRSVATGFGNYGIQIMSALAEHTLINGNDLLGSGDDFAIRDNGTSTSYGAGNRVKGGTWTTAQDYTP